MRTKNGIRLRALLLSAAFALAVLVSPLAQVQARAGGGQSYHGSSGGGSHSSSHSSSYHSSSSSGSSSGGSGSGGSGSPGAGVVLLIIIIVVIYTLNKKAKQKGLMAGGTVGAPDLSQVMTNFARNVTTVPPVINVAEQLAEFKERDPNFSAQQFEDMASTGFFKIQEAWSKRDMSIARSFVSVSLLQRFEAQIGQLKSAGQVNKMDNLAVGSVEIAEVSHDGSTDYITARVRASAADYTLDEKSGKIVSGSKNTTPFIEYWTFLRSDQVKTPVGTPELISKQCPNCGAPLQINAVGKCDYCGSDVTSGQFNWVLSEITQAEVWRPRATAPRPQNVSPLGSGRYVLGIVKCPKCGANVQDIAGITNERCWRCGATVETKS